MPDMDIKNIIAERAAQELKDGQIINLGIGVPTLVANHVPPGWTSSSTARTGPWASGRLRTPLCGDPDRANAGGRRSPSSPGGASSTRPRRSA